MLSPNPIVSIDAAGNVVVKGKPVTIQFTFPNPDYFPAGIAFVQLLADEDTSAAIRLGHSTFPQADIRLEDHAVTIRDTYDKPSSGYRYKFSIVLQNAAGEMGIIDPEIIHPPEFC